MASPFFSLSFSVSLLLLSFFLPSCLYFLLSFGSLFLSLSFFFCLLCFCFMKRTASKDSIAISFFHPSFLFFGFLSCFSFQIPFPDLCFFTDFKLCFLFNMNVFGFKTNNLKTHTHTFLVKRGVATKRFFCYELVFCKMSKVIVFLWGPILGIFWVMFKNTKNRHFGTFLKAKNCKQFAIFNGY